MGCSLWTDNYQSRFEGESGVVVQQNAVCRVADKVGLGSQSYNPRCRGGGMCVWVAMKDPVLSIVEGWSE
jgi:hypothetical protein